MKTMGRGRGIAIHFFSTLVLGGVVWSASLLGCFSPGKSLSTNLTGGWEGLRAGLDKCLKSHPHRSSNSKSSIPIPHLITLTVSDDQHKS